jgi:hypothetical protein
METAIEILSYDEMVAELIAHTQTLELPPGAEWPAPPPEPEPEPDAGGILRGHSYEAGTGKSIADGHWFCAWAREWLQQRGADPAREAAALDALRAYQQSYRYHQSLDPHARQATDERLQHAELGDPTGIARYVDVNC